MTVDRAFRSGHEDVHAPGGISSETETPIQLADDASGLIEVTDSDQWHVTEGAKPKPVDERTSEAEQARLEAKYDAWYAATQSSDVAGAADERLPLIVAQEFYDDAVKLEPTDEASALVAADYAEQIASMVVRSAQDPTDATAASILRSLAASMVARLTP